MPSRGRLAGSGIGSPANHSRDGESHSATVAAATSADAKAPANRPVRKRGTATTDSATRAPWLRCSTSQPSATAATAQSADTIANACATWIPASTERPRPGTPARNFSISSRLSIDLSRETVSQTESTTKVAPSITMTPAMVVWRGRAVVVLTSSFHHRGGCAGHPLPTQGGNPTINTLKE